MEDRRNYARYVLWFPITLITEGAEIGAICRDAGEGGVLVSTPVAVEPGTPVICRFRISRDTPDTFEVGGKVLRTIRNADELELVFPLRMAIEFTPPRPNIEELLRHAQERVRT